MHMPKDDLRHFLASGLSAWLAFEALCGRQKLFSERYLALPIAQILRQNVRGTVLAEHNHPLLRNPGPGRPPQVDYAIRRKGRVVHLLETKWVGSSGFTPSDLLWDCIRLELAAHHYRTDAYFLIAGSTKSIDGLIRSPSFHTPTSKKKSARLLNIEGHGRYSFNFVSTKGTFRRPLYRRIQTYPNATFAQSFICDTGIRRPLEAKDQKYTVLVWKIRPEMTHKRITVTAAQLPPP